MNQFRNAREFCFQYFFHIQLPVFESLKTDLLEDSRIQNLRLSIGEFKESTNTLLNDEANEYVEKQITSSLKNYAEIEEIIVANLKNWKLARISKVDHTNLVLSINELCFTKSAPMKVTINEAIEISKKFGSLESSAFINGILDNIAKKHQ